MSLLLFHPEAVSSLTVRSALIVIEAATAILLLDLGPGKPTTDRIRRKKEFLVIRFLTTIKAE